MAPGRTPRLSLGRWTYVALCSLAVLAALVGFRLGAAAGGGSAEAQAGDPETRALLGIFRESATAADEMPGDPASDLRASGDAQPGEDPTQSRRIDGIAAEPLYLWPKDGGVCASWGNCVPTSLLEKKGVAVSTSFGHAYRVAGIARDGIDEVTVTTKGGRELNAPVRENAFWLDLGQDVPLSITWRHPDGARETQADLVPKWAGDGPDPPEDENVTSLP